MDREEALQLVHKTAAEFAAANGHSLDGVSLDDETSDFLRDYGFNSLDALEYLLVLEEKFGITFEDEDLGEDVLSSAGSLVTYILDRQTTAPA